MRRTLATTVSVLASVTRRKIPHSTPYPPSFAAVARSPLGRIGLLHGHHAAHHDFHHSANVGNYGSALTDGLCGTMAAYLAAGGEDGQWAAKARAGKAL